MRENCSELKTNTSGRHQLHHFGVFIVGFGQVSHNVLISIVDFEQVNAGWEEYLTYSTCDGKRF